MKDRSTMASFMKGASLLLMAGFIVKLLSVAYRVPFQNLAGDRGFYVYQQIYPFVGVFTAWTSYGFSVAVSKMLADSREEEEGAILRIAFGCISGFAIIVFGLLFFGSPLLADWMGDSELAPLLKISALAVLLMPVLAVLKGFSQADQDMGPVASAQVFEQTVRVFVILIGTWIVVSYGFSIYAAGAAALWGTIAGELAGVTLLVLYTARTGWGFTVRSKVALWPTVRKMTALSVSLSFSSLLLLLFQLADSFTVFRLLEESGLPRLEAMERKGVYDRAQPLVQFGLLLASSLALSIVPLVARMDRKPGGRPPEHYVRLSFRAALLIAAATTAGLILTMPYVNEMLFKTTEGSATLAVFSIQVMWVSLLLVWMAILQGAGKEKVPALLLLAGLILKWTGNVVLVPALGIMGAALAGNIALIISTASLYYYFKRTWPIRFAPFAYYRKMAAALVSMAVCVLSWILLADSLLFNSLPDRLSAACTALTAAAVGAAVFLAAAAKMRILSEKEWYVIPFGRKMAKFQLWMNKNKRKGELR
ncbi:hypothetical protein B0X71_00260 [Planococcus lenghuensis]|uniref:Uncharacterized protein n=2 Tax=Planococcus lenghuensis TaxID=2213202 RepID=A0A1Q2L393_9BACL|nr:hypothetical protein B0X71_00260 [Planococcus lenghuensis]